MRTHLRAQNLLTTPTVRSNEASKQVPVWHLVSSCEEERSALFNNKKQLSFSLTDCELCWPRSSYFFFGSLLPRWVSSRTPLSLVYKFRHVTGWWWQLLPSFCFLSCRLPLTGNVCPDTSWEEKICLLPEFCGNCLMMSSIAGNVLYTQLGIRSLRAVPNLLNYLRIVGANFSIFLGKFTLAIFVTIWHSVWPESPTLWSSSERYLWPRHFEIFQPVIH